jgi:hypothetical protein
VSNHFNANQGLGIMNALIIPLLVFTLLCGCSGPQRNIPHDAPAIVLNDCRRAGDGVFSSREAAAIVAAQHHLESSDRRPLDAYYRVPHTAEGYEVFVLYVRGYDHSQPLFMPGGFSTVYVREDAAVIRVVGGL